MKSPYLTVIYLAALLAPSAPSAAETSAVDVRQLLVEAVTAAAAVDFYHAHCRGDATARRMDNLNELLVSSRRVTVLTIKDEYFPEQDYRQTEQRLEQEFMAQLNNYNGCAGAKAAGLLEQLKKRYETALAAIRKLP